MDISEVLAASREFAKMLLQIKSETKPAMPPDTKPEWEFGDQWYSYNSIGNVAFLDSLLTGDNRKIFDLVKDKSVADIGAADGDMGFFFSTLGFDVDIIDNPSTNWNHFRGAQTLKRILNSPAQIFAVNLDEQFRLPRDSYGLVFFLGILYHLQNPYYGLLHLAQCTEYCLISSRIARYAGNIEIKNIPVAYLLNPEECNNDCTNYWIFSQTGLKRMIGRAGWEILDWKTFGETVRSDVSAIDRDERAYALLKRRFK